MKKSQSEKLVQSVFEASRRKMPHSLRSKLESIPHMDNQSEKIYWTIHGFGILGLILAILLNWDAFISKIIVFSIQLGKALSLMGHPYFGLFLLPIPVMVLFSLGFFLYRKILV